MGVILALLSLSPLGLHGNLILWYFKSIAESGVTRFDVILGKRASHSYQQHMQRIECPEAVQELEYDIPTPTKVNEGRNACMHSDLCVCACMCVCMRINVIICISR